MAQAPGGRDNAFMVSKGLFEKASLPDKSGNFFLRPDRILGMFLLDPASPPADSESQVEALEREVDKDAATKAAVLAALAELESNDEGVRRIVARSSARKASVAAVREAPWPSAARKATEEEVDAQRRRISRGEFELGAVFNRLRGQSNVPWAKNPATEV